MDTSGNLIDFGALGIGSGPTPPPKIVSKGPIIIPTRHSDSAEKLKKAEDLAIRSRIQQVKNAIASGRITGWQGIINMGIQEAQAFKDQPWQQAILETCFKLHYETQIAANEQKRAKPIDERIDILQEAVDFSKLSRHEAKLGQGITLRPRQQKALDQILSVYEEWRADTRNPQAVYITMEGGSGKTFVAGALLAYAQQKYTKEMTGAGLYGAFYLTPSSILPQAQDQLPMIGAQHTGTQVMVGSLDSLRSAPLKSLFQPVKVPKKDHLGREVLNKEEERLQYNFLSPHIVILDEADWFKKPESLKSRYLQAWIDKGDTFFVFMSATPGSNMRDMQMFLRAAKLRSKHTGEPMTPEELWSFMSVINNGKPFIEDNQAALMRLREALPRLFINPPRDKTNLKLYNYVMLCEFKSQAHKDYYFSAQDRWEESQKQQGNTPDAWAAEMAAFTVLRQAEEWCKVPIFLDLATTWDKKGYDVVIGLNYQEAVRDMVITLVESGLYTRDQISVVWGGSTPVRREELVSEQEFHRIVKKKLMGEEPLESWEKTAWKKYQKYYKERTMRELTAEEHEVRTKKLKALNLITQTPVQRYHEARKFLRGDSRIMIFTLPAGGRGMNFDRQNTKARPRVSFLTVCYNGPEFMQAGMRTLRAASISDAIQFFVFMANTRVANHVAPKLDRRIAAIHRLATGGEDYHKVLRDDVIAGREGAKGYEFRKPGDNTFVTLDEMDIDTDVKDEIEDDDDAE